MPSESEATSTSHLVDAGDAGDVVNVSDAVKAVDKVESPRRDPKPLGTSILDSDGDLFLNAAHAEGTWLFCVCSATLRRHSRV